MSGSWRSSSGAGICGCPRRRSCRRVYDPTVLLTTAGHAAVQAVLPWRGGAAVARLTSCQKSFRTTDIENVGLTARHLTFFEMLGNFSVGDYFKEGAVEFALGALHRGTSASTSSDIWITVFGGDEELGLGPDEEAIERWRAVGVPDERIVRLGRDDNFWQSGPTGPVRPLLRALPRPRPRLRRGRRTARATTPSASSSSGTSSSCSTSSTRTARCPSCPRRTSTPAWASSAWRRSCRTSRRSTRPTSSRPLIELGEELSGSSYGQDAPTTRALRVIADHGRGATVPARRRRGARRTRTAATSSAASCAARSSRATCSASTEPFLVSGSASACATSSATSIRECKRDRPTIERWARAEEESFSRTLEQGQRLLAGGDRARQGGPHLLGVRGGRFQAARYSRAIRLRRARRTRPADARSCPAPAAARFGLQVSTSVCVSGLPGSPAPPATAATVCGTRAGSASGASSTSQTPSAYSGSSSPPPGAPAASCRAARAGERQQPRRAPAAASPPRSPARAR